MKSKTSTSNNPYKKKAIKKTWDLKSESYGDVDTANLCFMANDNNTTKLCSDPSLDDADLSIDELSDGFEQLSQNYDLLKMQYLNEERK